MYSHYKNYNIPKPPARVLATSLFGAVTNAIEYGSTLTCLEAMIENCLQMFDVGIRMKITPDKIAEIAINTALDKYLIWNIHKLFL